ncbi:hypothetical protein CSAL01_13290 [Colletotrichum salicis]|uniref:Glutamine repeat protein-1 n=1 Tax=Colletotrichum salicis TaxID=1209931 RepID=A0A135UUH5_9PEZI|nr:hypothetical protein CSAL01_13290 [Colletotrichum salicis]
MYAPGYGFSNVPPNFNTGAPPPNQNPHMQPGSVPTQPGQQMMYNPNQFAGMPGGQPGFVGGPNPAMMSGAGPAGMMQNAGMPHMAANGQKSRICVTPSDAAPWQSQHALPVDDRDKDRGATRARLSCSHSLTVIITIFHTHPPNDMAPQHLPASINGNTRLLTSMSLPVAFQNPYQGNPYGGNMPAPGGQHPNFGGMQGFPMNAAGMTPQQQQQMMMQQRMQAQQAHHHQQQQQQQQQQQGQGQGNHGNQGERDCQWHIVGIDALESRQRVPRTGEILIVKETPGEGDQARKPTQEEGSVQQDYSHCMRRLQANLAYLAALADRKGNVQVPPSPAYLSSPPLNMALKIRNSTPPGDIPENNPDPMTDREERSKYLTELYRKLQALFPNADPKKEPPFQAAGRPQGQPGQQGQGQRPPSHHASPAMAQAQRPMQMQNMPGAHQQQGMSLS